MPSAEFHRRFRKALGKVRDGKGIPVVYGVLPRRGALLMDGFPGR